MSTILIDQQILLKSSLSELKSMQEAAGEEEITLDVVLEEEDMVTPDKEILEEKAQQVALRIPPEEEEESTTLIRAMLNAIIATSSGIMQMNVGRNKVTSHNNILM